MKIFDSCRLMYGKKKFSKFLIAGCINAILIAVGGTVNRFVTIESVNDFIDGFCSAFGGVMIVFLSVIVMSGAFSAVLRINPGYKYFHSLADGAGHFKRVLVCSNLAGLFFIVLYAAVGAIFFWNFVVAYMIGAALFSMGWSNLTGGSNRVWVRFISFMVLGFVFGFIPGLLGEDSFELPPIASLIVISVSMLFYAACLIFTLIRINNIWNMEE